MDKVPDAQLAGLTDGQRNATRMILESPDRFTLVQGYAGVGKTTQFRAVMRPSARCRNGSSRALSAWPPPTGR